ncbi:MAG: hypothetical protein JJE03_00755 [Peptostreptococcaceae bacterium]|nr:hypothetical protein [Peptostreptococcaceae bacterium]
MDNFLPILITVISSIVIFSVTESAKEIWIEPLKEYKQIKKEIAKMFELYDYNLFDKVDIMQSSSNKYLFDYNNVTIELKDLAASLKGLIEIKPRVCIGIPRRKKLIDAVCSLKNIAEIVHNDLNVPDDVDYYDFLEEQMYIVKKNLKLSTY